MLLTVVILKGTLTVPITLAISNNSEVIYTQTDIEIFNEGTYESSEKQYERFANSYYATPKKISQYQLMMNEHEDILKNGAIKPRFTSVRLGVPFYNQENNYYCGPATVRQICGYLNGTSGLPSQSKIAKEMNTTSAGTDQQEIIDYLNAHTSKTYESLWKDGYYKSETDLYNLVISDIDNNKPTVACIVTTNNNWRYATSGHYLCYEGYTDDTTTNAHLINVVDPWLKGHGIASGKYSVSRSKAYSVTNRIGS